MISPFPTSSTVASIDLQQSPAASRKISECMFGLVATNAMREAVAHLGNAVLSLENRWNIVALGHQPIRAW